MNFIQRVCNLVFVTLTFFVGCSILLFVLHWLDIGFLDDILYVVYFDDRLRLALGISASVLLLVNLIFYQFFSINVHREKIIAFDNPSGRVTVSLMAIEDLLKRTILKLSEVKGVRPIIRATKRGLDITVRLTLTADVNIPDVAAKVQRIATKKIQDAVGLEEPMNVSIYVGKIIAEQGKGKNDEVEKEDKTNFQLPFHGYRA